MTLPLQGIRVIDLSQFVAGPAAACVLGQLGAEVIHVEKPGTGDAGRGNIQLYGVRTILPGDKSITFETCNINKKSITLNLQTGKGKGILYDLVKKSDVFITNYQPRVLADLQLDYDRLAEQNPKLIYGLVSLFGEEGPQSGIPGWDPLGQAKSSLMTTCGMGHEPVLATGAMSDTISAYTLAFGVVTAILSREKTGTGQKITTSQLQAVMGIVQRSYIAIKLLTGEDPKPHDWRNPDHPLVNYYPCQDGDWVLLSAFTKPYWKPTVKALGLDSVIDNTMLDDITSVSLHKKYLFEKLNVNFLTKTAREWENIAIASSIPLCKINRLADLENDPQVVANHYIEEYEHPSIGKMRAVAFPFSLSKTPISASGYAPECGQHTEEILIDLCGYSWDDIGVCKDEGII